MRKFLYTIVALLAALTATSCLYGLGTDEGTDVENTSGFKAEVSTNVISANGEDSAAFRAFFNGEDVTAEATLYDAQTNEALESMSFSTLTMGSYSFYVVYGEYRSEVIDVKAVLDIDLTDKDEQGITVTLSTNLVQVGKGYAAFIIRYNGKVLTADELAKVSVYNAADDTKVVIDTENSIGSEFNYVIVVDENDAEHTLLAFSPNEAGVRSFWFGYKTKNTRETPVSVTAVATDIPSRPVDPQPANTEFVQRVLFTQLTGTWCGYCPNMIEAFHYMFEEENYKDKFVHTAVHGSDQFATTLPDGRDLASILNTSGSYPYTIVNLSSGLNTNNSVENNIGAIMGAIENRLKTPARAGIAARTELKDNMLLVRTSIKVSYSGDYSIGAWLVESGLYAKQSNSTSVKEDYIDIHENVVRIADSNPSGIDFLGHPVGYVNKGETADHLFVMELDPEWKVENCHLVLFVSTTQYNQYQITNAVKTASLTSGVEFEYK
ncbi:MAG: Omp28-related outer membrane protein [Alistipes sp.]|nr:Omp28-related outer membrane protein [Alistipes sp.]